MRFCTMRVEEELWGFGYFYSTNSNNNRRTLISVSDEAERIIFLTAMTFRYLKDNSELMLQAIN